ncbi:MAG: phosphoglucosamine mutase [Planctomycetota bacterium]|nr:MAG: phosphoglucosamine mutase [Planctomycetota bacterium]
MFGTDGIRGYPNQGYFSPEKLVRLGRALCHFLRERGLDQPVLLGKDTRESGDMLASSLSAGLTSGGFSVVWGGVLPSGAVAYLSRKNDFSLGVVISASHNSGEYNGIKLFSAQGKKLKVEEERQIKRFYEEGRGVEGKGMGRIEISSSHFQAEYLQFLEEVFSGLSLTGFKVLLDCAHGACFQVAPEAFRRLGAYVDAYNVLPNGRNINQGCGATSPSFALERLQATEADIAFSFDGDGDRVIVIAPTGKVLDGDHLLAILALFYQRNGWLSSSRVVSTVMSNVGLERFLEQKGIQLERTEVGDRWVLEAMEAGGVVLGGEQSGHIILRRYHSTGDGILTALELMRVLVETGLSLEELLEGFRPYPQYLKSFSVSCKPPLEELTSLREICEEVRNRLGSEGRILLRYSGTEPLLRVMLEGESVSLLKELMERIGEGIEASSQLQGLGAG